jgi:hypothetical protein
MKSDLLLSMANLTFCRLIRVRRYSFRSVSLGQLDDKCGDVFARRSISSCGLTIIENGHSMPMDNESVLVMH